MLDLVYFIRSCYSNDSLMLGSDLNLSIQFYKHRQRSELELR